MSDVTRIRIKLGAQATGEKCGISYDGQRSHDIDVLELDSLLKVAQLEQWKTSPTDGAKLGKRLYEFLNGTGGRLKAAIDLAAFGDKHPDVGWDYNNIGVA